MLRIALTNDLAQLDTLAAEIARFAEAERVAEESLVQLNLVAEELFVNFVNYGSEPEGVFELSIDCDETGFALKLEDDGRPFNPLEAAPADIEAKLEDRKVGQLGLHLVRQVSSEMAYERANGRNVVTLTIPR